MLHYPLIRFGAIIGGPIAIAGSIVMAGLTTWAVGRLLEKPNAENNLRRAKAEESRRKAMEELTLPYHPETGDNPTGSEKRRRKP